MIKIYDLIKENNNIHFFPFHKVIFRSIANMVFDATMLFVTVDSLLAFTSFWGSMVTIF